MPIDQDLESNDLQVKTRAVRVQRFNHNLRKGTLRWHKTWIIVLLPPADQYQN